MNYNNGQCCGTNNSYVVPTPPNPSLQTWNGQTFVVADGSTQNPIFLPNLQQSNASNIQYVVGLTATGTFVLVPLSQIV